MEGYILKIFSVWWKWWYTATPYRRKPQKIDIRRSVQWICRAPFFSQMGNILSYETFGILWQFLSAECSSCQAKITKNCIDYDNTLLGFIGLNLLHNLCYCRFVECRGLRLTLYTKVKKNIPISKINVVEISHHTRCIVARGILQWYLISLKN